MPHQILVDPNREADVPAYGRDALYGHQLNTTGEHAPFALDKNSLYAGGICASESLSAKTFDKLKSVELVTADGFVNTSQLDGKKFAHQLAILPSIRQKDLINLLFWWEEECFRLRKLIQDEQELSMQIQEAQKVTDEESRVLVDRLMFEREKTRMRIKQKPSERREDVENGTDNLFSLPGPIVDGGPPEYRS